MKIGIDARLWNETGVGRYIRNLVENLYTLDHKNSYVLFVKSSDVSSIKNVFEKGKNYSKKRNNDWKLVIADVHWHSFREQITFPQIIYKENVDLMHFPYFSIPILYKKPYVITIHDLIIHHFSTGKASTLPIPLYQLKRVAYKLLLSNIMRNAKKIIVPLHAVKKDLQDTLAVTEEKIVVTYEGVDEAVKNTNNIQYTKGKKYFLYVGNAYPHKNVSTLIHAFIQFKNNPGTEEYILILVGKEDYFYKQLSSRLKEKYISYIQILHNVSDHFLSELYASAEAVVAPSYMEGFGLVPLEAMANATVVVASDIPAHREVCKDAAIYFDPHRVEDLQFALVNVMQIERTKKEKFILAGMRRQRNFSWKKMTEETVKIYESTFLKTQDKL